MTNSKFFYRKHEYSPDGLLIQKKYVLIDVRWLHVRLAKILAPEPDAVHDHSAAFGSLVLSGGYDESIWEKSMPKFGESAPRFCLADRAPDRTVQRRAGSTAWRAAATMHAVTRVLPRTWTLLIAFPANHEGRHCPHADQQVVERINKDNLSKVRAGFMREPSGVGVPSYADARRALAANGGDVGGAVRWLTQHGLTVDMQREPLA